MSTTCLTTINRRTAVSGIAISAMGAAGTGRVLGAGPIVIQFSHVVKPDTPKGKAALKFKALAEERTHGQVRVDVYPDSTLYKDREELDALRLGAVQMLAPAMSKLAGLGIPEFEVFDLPFLFKDDQAFRRACNSAIGLQLLQRLDTHNMTGLGYWENGFKVFTSNSPLLKPSDVQGKKIRVQSSRVLVAEVQALGATASVTPLANVYRALAAGQLDGQENTPSNIYSQRLHEVQKFLCVTRHGYLGYAVLVNKQFWERLPQPIRAQLQSALNDATLYGNAIAAKENLVALEGIRHSGKVLIHEPVERELHSWMTALSGVEVQARQWIGPAVIDGIKRAAAPP